MVLIACIDTVVFWNVAELKLEYFGTKEKNPSFFSFLKKVADGKLTARLRNKKKLVVVKNLQDKEVYRDEQS